MNLRRLTDRCAYCSFDPTSLNDYCEEHRPKMKKDMIVKQDAEQPIPAEVLASSIQSISDGMKKIRAGRLNDRALKVLLKDATGVPLYEIERVLNGIESLEATFLKKKLKGK